MASDAPLQIETTPLLQYGAGNMLRDRENNTQGTNGSQRTTPTCGSPTKAVIGLLLLVVVLSFTVISKLTLISMTSRLKAALERDEEGAAVSLYWQLLLVIMVPQCVTFVRTMMRGVCGKQTANFPWPTLRAQLMVSISSHACMHGFGKVHTQGKTVFFLGGGGGGGGGIGGSRGGAQIIFTNVKLYSQLIFTIYGGK